MAKSGNRIHGSLHGRVVKSWGKKSWLVDWMNSEGWSLEQSAKIDAGEWNERVEFFAEKGGKQVLLGVRIKGSSMDWDGACFTFGSSALGLGMRELEHRKEAS